MKTGWRGLAAVLSRAEWRGKSRDENSRFFSHGDLLKIVR